MTFNPASARSILALLSEIPLPDRELIVELGSQRYTSEHVFSAPSTRDFYIMNGFKEYLSLDINDREYNMKADLNEDFQLPDNRQASLVTNIGTSEHIFDQGNVFKNIHNLCKKDGIMFYHLPFTPWLNHGFFNYNPILFEALSDANDYQLLFIEVGDREGNVSHLSPKDILEEFKQTVLEEYAKKSPMPLFVYAALRKTKEQPFKKPFQKRYKKDIADDTIFQRYT